MQAKHPFKDTHQNINGGYDLWMLDFMHYLYISKFKDKPLPSFQVVQNGRDGHTENSYKPGTKMKDALQKYQV